MTMFLQDKILAAGIGPGLAQAMSDSVDLLTATGTIQSDAYEIRNAINRFSTVASGAGAKLWRNGQPGDEILVYNAGANALLVYPDLGASIDGGTVNASVSIPAGTQARFTKHNATLWSMQSESAVDISFTQSGTGASATTVQSELRRTIWCEQFGAVSGAADNSTAIQAALTYAGALASGGAIGATVRIGPGDFTCLNALTKPAKVNFIGAGMFATMLRFDGAHDGIREVDAGVTYAIDGGIEEMRIFGQNGALKGIDVNYRQEFVAKRLRIDGFAQQGVYLNHSIMASLDQCQISNNGGASYGQVEVDNSTTFKWDHSYISGNSGSTVAGLLIDRSGNTTILGGGIETTGVPIQIGSKTEATTGCVGGIIHGIDLENPGNGNPYIDIGAGLSAAALVAAWDVRGVTGYPSGTTTSTYAIRFKQADNIVVDANNFAQTGAATSTFELTGTGNLGVSIRAHRNLYGNTFPWVRVNSALVKAAGPYSDWNSDSVASGVRGLNPGIAGATPSILISSTQGGYYGQVYTSNGGATTVTALTGGERGMEIIIIAADANTTLTHSAVTADQFNMTGGANLLLTNGKAYKFVHNGTLWVQM